MRYTAKREVFENACYCKWNARFRMFVQTYRLCKLRMRGVTRKRESLERPIYNRLNTELTFPRAHSKLEVRCRKNGIREWKSRRFLKKRKCCNMMWEFYLSRKGWLLLLVETFNIFFFFSSTNYSQSIFHIKYYFHRFFKIVINPTG